MSVPRRQPLIIDCRCAGAEPAMIERDQVQAHRSRRGARNGLRCTFCDGWTIRTSPRVTQSREVHPLSLTICLAALINPHIARGERSRARGSL